MSSKELRTLTDAYMDAIDNYNRAFADYASARKKGKTEKTVNYETAKDTLLNTQYAMLNMVLDNILDFN